MKLQRLLLLLLLCYLPHNSQADQLTLGSWDFLGIDCFPGYLVGCCFEVTAGEGVEIIDITYWDWDQYDISYELYTDESYLYCSLSYWNVGVDFGADFLIRVCQDMWDPWYEIYLPYTFCDYPIPVPVINAINVTDGLVELSWDAALCLQEYRVYSALTPSGPFSPDNSGTFSGTSWTAPLPPANRFYYIVAVVNE